MAAFFQRNGAAGSRRNLKADARGLAGLQSLLPTSGNVANGSIAALTERSPLIKVTQKLQLRVRLPLTMFTKRPLFFKPSEQRLPLFAIFRDSAWCDVPQRKPLRRQVHVILRVAQIAHHR